MILDGWFDANGDGDHDTGEYGEDVNINGKVDSGVWGSGGETDPLNPDTDGDNMPDNWEQNLNKILEKPSPRNLYYPEMISQC